MAPHEESHAMREVMSVQGGSGAPASAMVHVSA
jgi:hypothetical protein